MASISITVSIPPLPEGWSGTPDQFMQKIAETIIFDSTGDFLTGQVGGAEPVSDAGLWIDGTQIKVWDEDLAQYVPIDTVPVGGVIMFAGAGTIPENYLECDDAEYDQEEYAALYAVIGDLYKHDGDSADNFRVPSTPGRFPVGVGVGNYNVKEDEVDWPVDGALTKRLTTLTAARSGRATAR
jgi:hypothetical protein